MTDNALSSNERAFLSVCQLKGDVPINQLAKEAGLPAHTAGRILRRLIQNGVLRPYSIVNHFLLGKFEIGLYLNILNTNQESPYKLKELQKLPEVASITTLGGRFNCCIDLLASNPVSQVHALSAIRNNQSCLVVDQEVVLRLKRTIFQRKLFSERGAFGGAISFEPTSNKESINADEQKLLDLLSLAPDQSLAYYGTKLGYSPAGIANKLHSLKKRKILLGKAYAVIALKLGLSVYRILLTTRALSKSDTDRFIRFCKLDRSTVTLTECLGAWNYEIRAEFLNIEEVTDFRARLEKVLGPSIQRIEFVPFLGTTHMSGYSP